MGKVAGNDEGVVEADHAWLVVEKGLLERLNGAIPVIQADPTNLFRMNHNIRPPGAQKATMAD